MPNECCKMGIIQWQSIKCVQRRQERTSFRDTEQTGQIKSQFQSAGHDLGRTVQFFGFLFPVIRFLLGDSQLPCSLNALLLLVILHIQANSFVDGMHIAHFIEYVKQKHECLGLILFGFEVLHDPGLQIPQFLAFLFYLGHDFLSDHEIVVIVWYFFVGEVGGFVVQLCWFFLLCAAC